MWITLTERITGSNRPRPDMMSLMDSQKDMADSGVAPGLGRIGVFTTEGAGAWETMGIGDAVRFDRSGG